MQADSLPAEPQGKPKNTGVGSLSLLQWIFLTQESNWGPLHCRWILYQLIYQGSPGEFSIVIGEKEFSNSFSSLLELLSYLWQTVLVYPLCLLTLFHLLIFMFYILHDFHSAKLILQFFQLYLVFCLTWIFIFRCLFLHHKTFI